MNKKNVVAGPSEFPTVPPNGYYQLAFKKDKAEKELLKEMKRNNKAAIDAKFGVEFSASQRKKFLNP